MATITVAGPFTEAQARETARALGDSNHGVYSREQTDAEGYGTGVHLWFVERDENAPPARIFGMTWDQIRAKQQGR